MRVISAPRRLKYAVGLLAACVPLAAFEVVLVTQAPWWRLPLPTIGLWTAAVAFICIPLGAWLLSGRAWALRGLGFLGVIWCLLTTWISYKTRSPAVGMLSLGLLIYWSVLFLW